jgi:hypothetical protein
MSSSNKTSKVTLEDKANTINEYSMEAYEGFDPNDFHLIAPEILREIKGLGLKHKWINAKQLADNHGFNKRGWKPYKVSAETLKKTGIYGASDTDGYYRRGDLVLAVMPEVMHGKLRAQIQQRNLANKAAMGSKQAAKQLRESLKDSKVSGVKILEGDED